MTTMGIIRSLPLFMCFMTGCVPQKQWRTLPAAPTATPSDVEHQFVIRPDSDKNRIYSLAFVEFKNDDKLWDSRQLDAALRAVDDADERSNHHALVIVFVHGWKNNAGQANNNVLDFRRQLNRIAADACGADVQHCGVLGIYMAWSGDIISRDWNTLRTLSYFNRRDVATVVSAPRSDATSVPISDALFQVMKQVKTGPGRSTNHTVVVGHSFGGLVLEHAISGRLQELGKELRGQLGDGNISDAVKLKSLDDFADLVVLINEAAPATNAVTLLSEYRQELGKVNLLRPPAQAACPPGDQSQNCKELTRPLILSISSETDLATRGVLPVAETIAPPAGRPKQLPANIQLPKGLDSKKVFTTAAPFIPQLHSHTLTKCNGADCTACLDHDKYYIPISIVLPAYAPGSSGNKDTPISYCLTRTEDRQAWNRTPYWIFTIPTEIVPDHGTIFTDRFVAFLTAFLPPLQTFSPTQPALPRQNLQMAAPR